MARSKFNLLCVPANMLDATSFYRSIGPLSQLRINRPSLQVQVIEQINWCSLSLADAVMLQRPYSPMHLQVAERARLHGLPLWIDHDDNLFELPKDNPCYENYMNAATRDIINKVFRLANVVTFSVDRLREVYSNNLHGKSVHNIANGLLTNVVGHIPKHAGEKRQPMILWRGSDTHQRDLDAFTTEILAAAEAMPQYRWVFQGYCTYPLLEGLGGKAERRKPIDPVDYFTLLSRMGPRIVVVPLADTSFNHGKSNIAWIEATYAGAVCLAPDWAEWKKPGVVTYKDRDDFFAKLIELMSWSNEEIDAQWKISRDYIEKNLTVESVNAKRSAVIDELEGLVSDEDWRLNRRQSIFDHALTDMAKAGQIKAA